VVGSEDGSRQAVVNREVLASVRGFLGGPSPDDAGWAFAFGEHLESNWNAVYGGALAAAMLSVARCAAPECSPRSLHIQLVRSVPRGMAYATADVRHAGRTVASVEVDLYDERSKLAAIALVTTVTPSAVAAGYHNTTATPFDVRTAPFEPLRAPVQSSLRMLREENGSTSERGARM
jgi:acyl-coenzyme A thioesterase PaaI-like protein